MEKDKTITASGTLSADGSILTVYSRTYCHLCDEMVDALRRVQPALGFHLEVVDVDSDPALEDRYGLLVPVLMAGEEEICHYHLDLAALDAYFGKIG